MNGRCQVVYTNMAYMSFIHEAVLRDSNINMDQNFKDVAKRMHYI